MINPSFLSLPAYLRTFLYNLLILIWYLARSWALSFNLIGGLFTRWHWQKNMRWFAQVFKVFCLVSACFRPMLTLGIELRFCQNIRKCIFTFRFLMALVTVPSNSYLNHLKRNSNLALLKYLLNSWAEVRKFWNDHLALEGSRDDLNIGFDDPEQS